MLGFSVTYYAFGNSTYIGTMGTCSGTEWSCCQNNDPSKTNIYFFVSKGAADCGDMLFKGPSLVNTSCLDLWGLAKKLCTGANKGSWSSSMCDSSKQQKA